jgi:hypothetical protein
LRKHEENYLTHDLELADVVHALKIWRHYLMRKRCEFYTDRKSLKYIFTHSDLNLRHRRSLKIIKDYDLGINYHPGVMEMEVGSTILQDIRKGQLEDEKIQEIKYNIKEEKSPRFMKDDQGALWYKGKIYLPIIKELKDKILHEAHEFGYSIHLGGNKMYHDLKTNYWWYGMKRDVAEYVALCDTCQRVKAEHQ